MGVKKESSGRRTLHLDVEVAGTPEQVWQAIATGAGISSWFVPTDVDEREGGRIVFHLDPGMDSTGVVTGWDPPRRFAYEERDWAPGAPPLATEFTVEARAGTCRVRLVHSLFASTDEWDDQLASFEGGWLSFFEVLRIARRDFPGKPCSTLRISRASEAPESETWDAMMRALGLAGVIEGQRPIAPAAGTPLFDGVVQRVRPREVVLKLEQPGAGAGVFAVYSWGERVNVSIALYLFGDEAPAIAERNAPPWHALVEHAIVPAQPQGAP
jgi:uncharacterized protein YndB with AHSA1/START domain